MTTQMVLEIIQKAFVVTFLVSAPLLIATFLVGVVTSFIQTLTQVHEVTITLIPKLITVYVIAILFMPWMMDVMIRFTQEMFSLITQAKGI
jgi:flagellar biosynthetic protein FliQ